MPDLLDGAEVDLDPQDDPTTRFSEANPKEREKARGNWGWLILLLFFVSTVGTLLLVCWAFYIDQKIIFEQIDLSNKPERIITTEVVLRLISATVFQVGAATAGIIGWAFFGSKGFDIFKIRQNS